MSELASLTTKKAQFYSKGFEQIYTKFWNKEISLEAEVMPICLYEEEMLVLDWIRSESLTIEIWRSPRIGLKPKDCLKMKKTNLLSRLSCAERMIEFLWTPFKKKKSINRNLWETFIESRGTKRSQEIKRYWET